MTASTELRPRVHLTPATGWLNDPHGMYVLDGTYHLFFQHVPDSLEWRTDIHWGHATSTDLLHWQMEPIALAPGDGDDGCWSGCAAIGERRPAGAVLHLGCRATTTSAAGSGSRDPPSPAPSGSRARSSPTR